MVRPEGARPVQHAPGVASRAGEGWPRSAETQLLHVTRTTVLARLECAEVPETHEHRRAAYLIAVLLGALRVRGSVAATPIPNAGSVESAAGVVAIDPGALAALSGLTRASCEHALGLLLAAGVIVADANLVTSQHRERASESTRQTPVTVPPLDGSPSSPRWAHFAADVLGPLPTADAVDWPFVLERLRGNAAALLTSWAFAELLTRPDRYASVPRSALQAHTLYGEGMVKRSLGILCGERIIERTAQNAYRFTDLALGRVLERQRPTPSAAPGAAPALSTARRETESSVPSATSAGLVSFMAGGLPLALPRDVQIEIETEVDGRPIKLRLRFPSV